MMTAKSTKISSVICKSDEAREPRRRQLLRMAGVGALAAPFAGFFSPEYAQAQIAGAPSESNIGSPHKASTMNELIPSSTQFLFVDLQPKIMASSRTLTPDVLAATVGVLADGAALLGCPMTFAFAPEGPGLDPSPVSEHAAYTKSNASFVRKVTGPFLDTRIANQIRSNGRRSLIIAGYTVEVAIIQSVIGARSAGFDVFIPIDGMASRSKRTELAALREIEMLGGIVTSARSLLMRLAPDLSTPTGQKMLAIVSKLRESEYD